METKKCNKCNTVKSIDEFNWKHKDKVRHSYCRICSNKISCTHYKENPQPYKERSKAFRNEVRASNRLLLSEYLRTHPCVDCGESDPIVLQFDHVKGQKKKTISEMKNTSYSWETIEEEIDKCEVRCANCHTRRTSKQFNWTK